MRKPGKDAPPPKFSVVTCSYNQGCFIADTIESVLAQKYPLFEHIVVDGGSRDNSREVCARYPHVRFIDAPGTSQAQALNLGFREVTGDIVAWVNSDDYYEPHAFRIAAASISPADGVYIATGGSRVVDAAREQLWIMPNGPVERNRLLFHPRLYRRKGRMCMPCQPATFFHRHVLDTLGPLQEDLNYGMDYEYWLRALYRGFSFHYVAEILADYRYHSASKTVEAGFDKFLPEWDRVSESYIRRLSPAARLAAEAWWLRSLPDTAAWRRLHARLERETGRVKAVAPPAPPQPPLVSVVVPAYNSERHLRGTIETVLAQTYPHWELIVVDDGSRDASLQIARDLAQQHPERIRVFTHPDRANRGVSATRNLGIREARGKYIAFLDADDRWRPDKLRRQVSLMESNPQIGLSYTKSGILREGIGEQFVPGAEKLGWAAPADRVAALTLLLTLDLNYIFSSVMVRADALREAGGFDEDLPFQSEDRILVTKICSRHKLGFVGRNLCEYLSHDGSYTAQVLRRKMVHVIVFDMQVRVIEWLKRRERNRALAEELAVRLIPLAFLRAVFSTASPALQWQAWKALARVLMVLPALPVTFLRWRMRHSWPGQVLHVLRRA